MKAVSAACGAMLAMWIPAVLGAQKKEPSYDGKPLSHWFKLCLEKDARPDASLAIVKIGAPAVPALIGFLKDRGTGTRDTLSQRVLAADLLGRIGPPAKDALPALREAEKVDPDSMVRVIASSAIKRIDKPVEKP